MVPACDAGPVCARLSDRHPRGSRAPWRELGTANSSRKKEEALIPLTVPEVRRLIMRVAWPHLTPAERVLAWSSWRRHHQAVAQACHYRKRQAQPPTYLQL